MKVYQLLNTIFRINSTEVDVFAYIDSFMGQYDSPFSSLPVIRTIDITVKRKVIELQKEGKLERLPVHVTKHPYWNFDAICYKSSPLHVVWPQRKIEFVFIELNSSLNISVDPTVSFSFAGEYVFHCMRSFALYLREVNDCFFLHASAIQWKGKGILFVGSANAGKTTLFLDSVLNHDALPLCNDRVLIKIQPKSLYGHSWPSYVSVCEGTILNDTRLTEASINYDNQTPVYKTIQWASPLKNSFLKSDKRIYPLQWLTAIMHKKYIQCSTIDLIVFPELVAKYCFELLTLNVSNTDDERWVRERLSENTFDSMEPSFKPWHKFPFPSPANDLSMLINTVKNTNIAFIKMKIAISKIPEAFCQLKSLL